ncbi:MAG TPA: hypothetical protein VIV11_31200 [Kofleriaceae bacterium]
MSYLHCPTCKCAYNIALSALCPNCPVPMSEVDPAEDIVAAAERLAHAMARATPSERKIATTRMDQLALPAPGAKPVTFHGAMLRSIREAIEPVAPPPVPKPQPLLAAIAYAVVEKISERIQEKAPQLMERIPSRLRRAGSLVRARMRALAA